MRQQARFREYPPGHRGDILQGGLVTERLQRMAGGAVALFGFLAQGEEGFPAALRRALARQRQRRVHTHIR